MGLRETVYSRCTTHTGTSALVSTRVYPVLVPEGPTWPLIVYHRISANDSAYRDHDAPTTREVSRVQLDCYASTSDGAAALADQVQAAFNGWHSGSTVGWAFKVNRIADYDTALKAYKQIVDVMIEHAI